MPHKRAKKSVRDSATQSRGFDNAPTAIDLVPQGPVASTSQFVPVKLGAGVLAPSDEKKKKVKKVQAKDKFNVFGGRSDLGGMSKSAYRILNAGAVRDEYHANQKRKIEELAAAAAKGKKGKKPLEMLPYETLGEFNRRVEVALRPSIDSAIRGAKASSAKGKKDKAQAKKDRAAALLAAAADAKAKADDPDGTAAAKPKAAPVDPFVPPVKERPLKEFAEASQKRRIGDVAMAPPTLKKARRGGDVDGSMHDAIPIGRMPMSEGLKKIMELEREKAVRLYRDLKEKRDAEQALANHS